MPTDPPSSPKMRKKVSEKPASTTRPLVLAALFVVGSMLIRKWWGKKPKPPEQQAERKTPAPPQHATRLVRQDPSGQQAERDTPAPHPIGPAYEEKDASVSWIFGVVAILAVSAIAIHFLLSGMLDHLQAKPATGDQWQPISRPPGGLVGPLAPYPKLQVSPPFDLEAFRAREEARLNSYGWVNQTAGIARVPIDVAMDLLLKKGIPVRTQTNAAGAKGPSPYELQVQRVEQRPKIQEDTR